MSTPNKEVRIRLLEELLVLTTEATLHQFAIGDKLLEMQNLEGGWSGYLEEASAVTGYEVQSLRDIATTAERIPVSLRNEKLGWSQFVAIGRLKKKDSFGCVDPEASLEARAQLIANTDPDTTVRELRSIVGTLTKHVYEVTLSYDLVEFLVSSKRVKGIKDVGNWVQDLVATQIIGLMNGSVVEAELLTDISRYTIFDFLESQPYVEIPTPYQIGSVSVTSEPSDELNHEFDGPNFVASESVGAFG